MPRFSKYSGGGNDFVLVRGEEVGLADPGHLARRICPRATGVGVDGLILVRSLSPSWIRVRFFNPDGSEFSTCGNGSRCAALYAVDRGLVGEGHLVLATDAGEVEAEVRDGGVALDYRIDARVEREVEVEMDGTPRAAWLVQIGTPHLVVPVDALPEEGFEDVCRPIRHHPALGEQGANVDLVSAAGPDAARIRTFERGVEGETLACGSGAMAAALVLRELGLAGASASFVTRSGAVLTVELPEAEPSGAEPTIRLAGPASFLFDGVFPDWTGSGEGERA